jgi:ATP-binding cassette subfamily B protein
LALVAGAAPFTAAAYLAIVIFLKLLPVLQVWLTKLVVDSLQVSAAGGSDILIRAIMLAALYALTLVVMAGLQPIQEVLLAWLEGRAVAEVDHRLMQAGTGLVDLYRIERAAFQDELRLSQEASYRSPRLFMVLQQGLGTLLTLSGLLLLLARLQPLLPLVLVAASVPYLVAEERLNKLKYTVMTGHSRAAREMDYCVNVTTEPTAAKEVRVFVLGDFFLERLCDRSFAALSEVSQLRLKQLRLSAMFGCLNALALAGGFWYVATQARIGLLTLGDIALYLNAVMQAQSLVMGLQFSLSFLYEIVLHLRGLFTLLDEAKPNIALAVPSQAQRAPAVLRSGIQLRQVSFRYPESAQVVLDSVSTLLPAGKVTALVGTNGAGKSTLVKLLTRMYDPDTGEILFDGVPLSDYNLESLRGRIAVMYQDFARFALTMGENITVGAIELGEDDGCLEVAGRWAGADGVAARLPQGYDTQLTRRFEGGVELSGGEWQKVALARSFVRDAALVILDEPTAALDAEAEYQLFERFRELMVGKAALLISHRFSTVRMADQILVLEGGRIEEAGSHAELIALGGRYAALYDMQAGRYR